MYKKTRLSTLTIFLSKFFAGLFILQSASAATFFTGDVFVGVSNGQYQHYDGAGNLLETLSDSLGGFTTGCAFDSAGNLYTTNFSNTKVIKYDNAHPHPILQTIDTGAASPNGHSESIVFDAVGNFYVGHPDGNRLIHKYDAAGNLLTTFNVAVDARGTDWIDLATDQTTMFYTSEGRAIQRFDVGSNVQLPNFAVLPGGGAAFALRLLSPGDGSGGLLVADLNNVKRLDSAGNVAQTYDVAGEDSWFSLNLDPNGTSFWAGNFGSANFYRFNIATGAIELGPLNTGTGTFTLFGICVFKELTAALGDILDPVPSLLSGPNITTDTNVLAEQGRPVSGVAADGVTQVVLRVSAEFVGELFSFSIINDQGNSSTSTDEDGALGSLGTSPTQGTISVSAVDTTVGPMAFAIYRAPIDFPRSTTDDSNAKSRTVTVKITSQSLGGSPLDLPIQIIRSPVILVHGFWEGPASWDTFTPLVNDSRFSPMQRVDYDERIRITGSTPQYSTEVLERANRNQLGFNFNSIRVLSQIRTFIDLFKKSQNPVSIDVAAIQADLVTHSMGGDIARTLPLRPNFLSNDTFGNGVIHKLITIGTPHLGTPLATQLLQDANSCVRNDILAETTESSISFANVTILGTRIVNGGVFDLQGDGLVRGTLSRALRDIQRNTRRRLPTAMIAGVMSANQLNELDCGLISLCNPALIRWKCEGDPLADNLTVQGWPTIVSQDSDAIVPLTSQLNGLVGSPATDDSFEAVHSPGTVQLGFGGPHEYEQGSNIPDKVIELLNTPITSNSFVCLPGANSWPCN